MIIMRKGMRSIAYIDLLYISFVVVLILVEYLISRDLLISSTIASPVILSILLTYLIKRDLIPLGVLISIFLGTIVYIKDLVLMIYGVSVVVILYASILLIEYLFTKTLKWVIKKYIDALFIALLVVIVPIYTAVLMDHMYVGDGASVRFSLGVLVASSLYYVFSIFAQSDLGKLGLFYSQLAKDLYKITEFLRKLRIFLIVFLFFFLLTQDPLASLILIVSEITIYFFKRSFSPKEFYEDLFNLTTPVILLIYLRIPPPIP
ncbi:MAG: hypothetical protein ACP5GI_07505 [Sulfolobales archaeon]